MNVKQKILSNKNIPTPTKVDTTANENKTILRKSDETVNDLSNHFKNLNVEDKWGKPKHNNQTWVGE